MAIGPSTAATGYWRSRSTRPVSVGGFVTAHGFTVPPTLTAGCSRQHRGPGRVAGSGPCPDPGCVLPTLPPSVRVADGPSIAGITGQFDSSVTWEAIPELSRRWPWLPLKGPLGAEDVALDWALGIDGIHLPNQAAARSTGPPSTCFP